MTTPLEPSYREIPLTQGQVAVVDADLYEWLNQWKWHAWWNKATKSFYAVRNLPRGNNPRSEWMHRVILGLSPGDKRKGDHIKSGQTLLNVRDNLRIATHSQNNMNSRIQRNNTTGFKGVSFHKPSGRWRAVVKVDGKQISLGLHESPEAAHEAYKTGALKHHGEFANFA